jgi:hypothetical protein
MTRRNSTKDIDLGFGIHDSSEHFINQRPKVQLLIPHEPPKEQQVKYCSSCNQKIQWLTQTRRWICYACGVTYSELYDTLLSSLDQQIKPLQGDHAEKPTFISAKPKSEFTEGRNIDDDTIVTGNLRRCSIKTTNLTKVLDEKWIRSQLEGDAVYGYWRY